MSSTSSTLTFDQINKLTSHYACRNVAADYIDRADEERALSSDLMNKITQIAVVVIIALGAITMSCASALCFEVVATVASESMMVTAIWGGCSILGIAVPIILYLGYQRSVHHEMAREFENKSLYANARAAEIPAYKDYGFVLRIFGSLFHPGNSVTRYGEEKVGGRTTRTPLKPYYYA